MNNKNNNFSLNKLNNNYNKIALGIEYDGSNYYGWQRQKKLKTIQSTIESAIHQITNEHIQVYCAGRTDKGVHAIRQVVHFETKKIYKQSTWINGINSFLPNDIVICWQKTVDSSFHARFSAISRKYRYIILNHQCRPAILSNYVTHYKFKLDFKKMHTAAQFLIGEHDFTPFRSNSCQSKTPFRNVKEINIYRHGYYIIIDIIANSFLYHMVRNIVGTLIQIGSGKKDIYWIKKILSLKNKFFSIETAKAKGLYLVSINYPIEYKIPIEKIENIFLT
ncbi:MAG: tRNA pseudouridine(38-40) synthase TruA [Arsenophonus sp.]|nr:MAG: tRNA pseudouridine(38-40) synthase TruA [Arsenophonus sp.]